ncbi:MAG: 3-oxoacyl-ACP reductase FabG [Halarsenatibacteraceae bacterium]
MKLKEKVAIVTGGASGIGKGVAELFIEEGAKVVIADYDVEKGKKTAEELNENGQALFVQVDVSDTEAAEAMVEKTVEEFGKVDILINNAGVTADGFLSKMSEDAWDKVIDVNLKGVFNCSKFAAQKMMETDGGVILNASSVVGLYGNVGQTNYAASKFGVIGLTKTWAKELAGKGVRVNCIAPGFTKTEMIEAVPDKLLDKMKKKTPVGRLGEVEDIANAYLFLASDDASYINGAVLPVDGGLVLG